MLGNLPVVDGKRITCVEPMGLNSNGRRQLRPLLRQHAQYVAVLTHDRFGQRHLCLKAGVAWRQVKAVRGFRQIQIVAKRHPQLGEYLFGKNHTGAVADFYNFKRFVHTGVITQTLLQLQVRHIDVHGLRNHVGRAEGRHKAYVGCRKRASSRKVYIVGLCGGFL